MLSEDVKDYVEQGIEFSRLTRFDVKDYRTANEGNFSFDFQKAEQLGYEVDPSEIKIDRVKITASYSEDDLETIQRVTELWGTETLLEIGKLFKQYNMLRMRRDVIDIDPDGILTAINAGRTSR